jgi:hypothetical protein
MGAFAPPPRPPRERFRQPLGLSPHENMLACMIDNLQT